MKKCKSCWVDLEEGTRKDYCSDECKEKSSRSNAALYRYKRKLSGEVVAPLKDRVIVCKVCCDQFTPIKTRQSYCGYECRKIAENLRSVMYSKAKRLKLQNEKM